MQFCKVKYNSLHKYEWNLKDEEMEIIENNEKENYVIALYCGINNFFEIKIFKDDIEIINEVK